MFILSIDRSDVARFDSVDDAKEFAERVSESSHTERSWNECRLVNGETVHFAMFFNMTDAGTLSVFMVRPSNS